MLRQKLDKVKSYCYKCFCQDIITELGFDINTNKFIAPDCGHYGGGYHRFSFVSKYNDWLAIGGMFLNAKSKREIVEEQKLPGKCSMCNKYNNIRDQNNRGKDNKEWINDLNEECGCNCSKDFYNKHNSSEAMKKQAMEVGKIHGPQNLINYNKSDDHRETARKIGLVTVKENFKRSFIFCKECGIETNHKGRVCTKCYPNAIAGIGWHTSFCEKCNKHTLYNGNSCTSCDPYSLGAVGMKNFVIRDNIKYYKDIEVNEFILQLNNKEIEIPYGFNKRFGEWYYNCENILTGEILKLNNNNFIIKNNIKYYKEIDINIFLKQLDNKEIKIPPGFNKRNNKWHYYTEGILTGKITKLNNINFIIKDKIKYYLDPVIKDYIIWKEYSKNFKLKNIKNNILSKIQSIYIGEFMPTFITNESNINCGHAALDQYLLDQNIDYFVYLKFYNDINYNSKPLVVGQTASLNINNRGCDLSFSFDNNHGPSRVFMNEQKLDYLYEQIFVIKTESRDESLRIEREIEQNYGLFTS